MSNEIIKKLNGVNFVPFFLNSSITGIDMHMNAYLYDRKREEFNEDRVSCDDSLTYSCCCQRYLICT